MMGIDDLATFLKNSSWDGRCPFCQRKDNLKRIEVGDGFDLGERDYRYDCGNCKKYFYVSFPKN